MFRHRRNSQKPSDELYDTFKAAFPRLAPQDLSQASHSQCNSAVDDSLSAPIDAQKPAEEHDFKDAVPTPQGISESWRLTPSLLDPNSFAFNSFANELPGYYTPTPGGMHTLYHHQAGDLHTPNMFGMATPLSLPTSDGRIHAAHLSSMNPLAYHGHGVAAHQFSAHGAFNEQQTFAPHQLSRQMSEFDGSTALVANKSLDEFLEIDMNDHSPVRSFPSHVFGGTMRPPPIEDSDKFKYHVTLNAPTAMVKHANEIPVTYLNKGQAYTIAISDTAPQYSPGTPVKYRTFVRISFEDEYQRQKPGACWQLWKEGRGINEAHQRGGRLQAVEYVDPSQGCDDPNKRPRIELQTASFDGFSVTWMPSLTGSPECSLALRFNFLSTDFSHSKGVKGIPVRLSAKTELLSIERSSVARGLPAEICYCKVKLFRDHGAERKLSNDVQHVKKTIDKLKQQITQAESGIKECGKRKRSSSIAKLSVDTRPGKVPKHRRTWSTASTGSNSGDRPPIEEDVHTKLASLQDMFTSTRPASVLHLRGAEEDDPDLHPVHLAGEPMDLTKLDTSDSNAWEKQSTRTTSACSIVSPAFSITPNQSPEMRKSSVEQPSQVDPLSRESSHEWPRPAPQNALVGLQSTNPQHLASPPDQPVRVQKVEAGDQSGLSGWIETLGVDFSYQPPAEQVTKPVACFYIQPRIIGSKCADTFYRAIYVMQRTLQDLIDAVGSKSDIEPTKVVRTLRVNNEGLQIIVDDDVVRELPEGQDMKAEFHEVEPQSPRLKTEGHGTSPDEEMLCDGNIAVTSRAYELRLLY